MFTHLLRQLAANPLIWVAAIIYIIYRFRKPILHALEWVIRQFTVIPYGFRGKILAAFYRVVYLNWYTFLMLTLLWLLVMPTDVGSDLASAYLSNLKSYDFGGRIASLFFLFGLALMLSLSIWIIPFFMFSPKRIDKIKGEHVRFYLATKMLALVAMAPFLIVINRFFWLPNNPDRHFGAIVGLNVLSIVVFLALIIVIKQASGKKIVKTGAKKMGRVTKSLLFGKLKENPYLYIILKILLWVLLLTIIGSVLTSMIPLVGLNYLVAAFMYISSAVVFDLLFYTNESGHEKTEIIKKLVEDMLSEENRKHSRTLYYTHFWFLIGATLYFYFVPSLEGTSGLYVLLILFSFFITYFDYWRNVFMNKSIGWKFLSIAATFVLLALPFLSNRDQFRISLIDLPKDIPVKLSLEDALARRLDTINHKNPTADIYIVCAMGGGSRAGFITASVLDKLDTSLWDRTICYSTISGSSVGTYNYIKEKESTILGHETFYKNIYEKNYNSSGIYNLLIGDGIERLLGPLAIYPKDVVANDYPVLGFHDRNERIRKEYDYVLQEALSDHPSYGYWQTTFHSWGSNAKPLNDSFQTYFHRRIGSLPIHLVNTFEVNSGRRTVVSPFPTATTIFPNAVMPLQMDTFDRDIKRKEILYREAVNLSELFPIVSAASYIGDNCDAQFVDGGYYENYGLSTGLDIYYYLKNVKNVPADRLKILLIRNSRQVPNESGHQIQLFAPLAGAMNSPFTGHANHLLEEARRIVGMNNFHVITFNADSARVPLTRSLTEGHINSMRQFIECLKDDKELMMFLKR